MRVIPSRLLSAQTSAAPITAPGTELTRNDAEKKRKPTLLPIAGPRSFAPTHAPTIPRAYGLGAGGGDFVFVGQGARREADEERAEHAAREGEEAARAEQVADDARREGRADGHHGPRTIPATTLIVCWNGKHFVGPIGMETTESATPAAASTPASTAFLKIRLCLSFVIFYLSSYPKYLFISFISARAAFSGRRRALSRRERYAARAAARELAHVVELDAAYRDGWKFYRRERFFDSRGAYDDRVALRRRAEGRAAAYVVRAEPLRLARELRRCAPCRRL